MWKIDSLQFEAAKRAHIDCLTFVGRLLGKREPNILRLIAHNLSIVKVVYLIILSYRHTCRTL